MLMLFEDAHWIDPTSRELLDLIVDRVRRSPVLLAISFRPELQPPWSGRSHVTSLVLNRLGERDGAALARQLAGNAALSPDIVAQIVERTDGVPLFVEELTKAVLESAGQGDRVAAVLAAASAAALSVPATLHASLMARLDRLGPVSKEVAQIGAVLGREFPYELVELVAQRDERELQAAVGSAQRCGIAVLPRCRSAFILPLQARAGAGCRLQTLLRGRRQELHAQAAAVLEGYFADLVEREPELLAHHLTAAGNTDRAIDQWLKAGAMRRRALLIWRRSVISIAVLGPCSPTRRTDFGTDARSSCNWPEDRRCSRRKGSQRPTRPRLTRAPANSPSSGTMNASCLRHSTASGNLPTAPA